MDLTTEAPKAEILVLVDGRIIGSVNTLNLGGGANIGMSASFSGVAADIAFDISAALLARIVAAEALLVTHTAQIANHEARLVAGGL